ncbi:MAG: hypothetical protein RR840_00585 [Clostridium sp.]
MLELTLIEMIFRAIPECLIYFWAIYVFSMVPINYKKYLLGSFVFAISLFFIRLLPVHYGVHTVICTLFIFLISYKICKIDIINAGRSTIIAVIVQLLTEGVNLVLIEKVFKLDINAIFGDKILKVLYGIPSLILYVCVVFVFYYATRRRYVKSDKRRNFIK